VIALTVACGDAKDPDGSDGVAVDYSGVWEATMTDWSSSINDGSEVSFRFLIAGQDIENLTYSLALVSGSLSCETECVDESLSCALPDAVTFTGDGFRVAERSNSSYTIYGTFIDEFSVEGTANWFVRFCGSFDGNWQATKVP
jgi:hypothetical protein